MQLVQCSLYGLQHRQGILHHLRLHLRNEPAVLQRNQIGVRELLGLLPALPLLRRGRWRWRWRRRLGLLSARSPGRLCGPTLHRLWRWNWSTSTGLTRLLSSLVPSSHRSRLLEARPRVLLLGDSDLAANPHGQQWGIGRQDGAWISHFSHEQLVESLMSGRILGLALAFALSGGAEEQSIHHNVTVPCIAIRARFVSRERPALITTVVLEDPSSAHIQPEKQRTNVGQQVSLSYLEAA